MNNPLTKFVLFFFFMMISSSVIWAADPPIKTDGNWGEEGKKKRSLVPAEPVAYINSNILTIYFENVIENLYVCVTDSDNSIVYAGYISAPSADYTSAGILLMLTSGENYQLEMSHVTYGYLSGTFEY